MREELLREREEKRQHYRAIDSKIEEYRVQYEAVEEKIKEGERELIHLTTYLKNRQA